MGAPDARLRRVTTEAPIRDAATVIILRRDAGETRVLMGMRGAKAAFMPSKFVFPGGAVDLADADVPLAARLRDDCHRRLVDPDGQNSPHTIAVAALRELAEETGLLIGQAGKSALAGYAEAGLMPDASALRYLFRAITPAGRPRRFDAHFFIADAARVHGDPDDFSRACDELSHLHWVTLSEARNLDLPFITEVVLAELSQLIAGLPHGSPLPCPASVPFFDNRTTTPTFSQIT
ncbi:DNA mismatch repair protein MutT [Paracoccus sp. R86501]|uniref:NUDIX hydrolase n=1 Tax=Paracoccus sp. R86501 TaxID=3101711 RepID=UPI00366E6EB2